MPDFPFLGSTAAGLPSDQELLAIADPNPRNQQQRLDAGRPDEVLRLAEDFSAAGGDMTQAHEFSSLAQRWISQGMTRDGTPVYDQTAHLKALPGDFAALGPQMIRASKTLGDAAAHLKGAQGVAAEALGVMYAALDSARRDWADLVVRLSARPFLGVGLGGVDDQLKLGRELIIGSMQQAIRDAAAKITPVLTGYEDQLGAVLADVRKLGYLPPESFDGGPAADGFRVADAATTDGQGLRDALAQPAGPRQLAAVEAASGHLRDLQHKLEAGGQLDAEDRTYLKTFYETAGPQAIGGLPGHIRDSVATQGLDLVAAKARYESLVTPFGDTITGMAGGTVADPGGHQRAAGYADLPPVVQSLIDTRKGVIDPETGVRLPNERFIQGAAAADLPGGGVTGMSGYRGITDILATSKIDPSPDLAKHMIESAVQTRQDLNVVEEMGQHKLGGEPSTVAALHTAADASAAETALKFGARSVEGSSAALLDDRTRPALMGLNWQDGTGAAAVIDAGTNRDPASGGGHEAQARAALAVIQEAQRDPEGYLGKPAVPGDPGHPGRMAGPVIDAVDTVGIRYLDAFGRPPLGPDFPSAAVNENLDPVGRPLGWSLNLSPDDQQGFLNFVSASGDQQLTRFHTAADIYNQHIVADALRHGDGAEVNSALGQAGHLDGSLAHAAEHQVSLVAEHTDQAGFSTRAAQIESRSDQAALNIAVTIGKEAIGAIPGVAAVKAVASPVLAVLADMAKGDVSLATIADSAPQPTAAAATAHEIESSNAQIPLQQTVLLTTAANDAGLFPGGPPALLTADQEGPGGVGRPDGRVDRPGVNTQDPLAAATAADRALAGWNRSHGDVAVSPNAYAFAHDLAAAQGVAPPQRQDSDWNHRPVDLQYGPDPVDRTPFLRWDPP